MRKKEFQFNTEKTFDFVEIEDSKFVSQLGRFWQGLTQHGALLGFSSTEIDDAEKDYLRMKYAMVEQERIQSFAKAYTGYKKSLRKGKAKSGIEPLYETVPSPPASVAPGIEKRFRKRAAKAKASAGYNAIIGTTLNIIGMRRTFESSQYTPKFKIEMKAGRPLLKFTKKFYQAIDIYKDDGSGFKMFQRVILPTYHDKSPLPAKDKAAAWKYKIIGVLNDQAVGAFSGEHTVLVYDE